jgi:hypothetical protein
MHYLIMQKSHDAPPSQTKTPGHLERRKNVARRYLQGQTQAEIALAFETDQATISRDLSEIQKEWLTAAILDGGIWTARELAKIDEVERLAWTGWFRSQENAETLRARRHEDTGETEKVVRNQAGDAGFLQVILTCIQRRCDLLGLNAPKEHRVQGEIDIKTIVAVLPAEST